MRSTDVHQVIEQMTKQTWTQADHAIGMFLQNQTIDTRGSDNDHIKHYASNNVDVVEWRSLSISSLDLKLSFSI